MFRRIASRATCRVLLPSLAVLAMATAAARAAIDEPDAIYYGDVTIDGAPADAGTEISATVGGELLDRYEIGSLGGAGLQYLLRIPVAQMTRPNEPRVRTAFEGDVVRIFIGERFANVVSVTGGTITELSLVEVPLTIPDLELWLDALDFANVLQDGDPVGVWADKSPNAADATQAALGQQPTIAFGGPNDRPVLRFDGVDDFLGNATFTAINGLSGVTAFVVRRTNALTGLHTALAVDQSKVRSGIDTNLSLSYSALSAIGRAAFSSTEWHLWSSIFDGTALGNDNRLRQLIDGVEQVQTYGPSFPGTQLGGGAGYDVGRPFNSSFRFWDGEIAEVMIYGRALSVEERQRIEAYLATKYDLQGVPIVVPPTNTPTPTHTATPGGPTPTSTPTPTPSGGTFTPTETPSHTPIQSPTPTPVNLALGQPATQSSTLLGGVASRAVDGDTDGNWHAGSVSLTDLDNPAWWEVDLGISSSIERIDVYNRTDCCGVRTAGYYVLVSETPNPEPSQGALEFFQSDVAGSPTSIPVQSSGRYVRVYLSRAGGQHLHLAEVEVWGAAGAPPMAPAVTSSPAGIVGDTTPRFAWSEIPGTREYWLTLVDVTMRDVMQPMTTRDTSYELDTPLIEGHRYEWQIQALTRSGWTEPSGWLAFSVTSCLGDADSDGSVRVPELVRAVMVATAQAPVAMCGACDSDSDGAVSVSELVRAVNNALHGCN